MVNLIRHDQQVGLEIFIVEEGFGSEWEYSPPFTFFLLVG